MAQLTKSTDAFNPPTEQVEPGSYLKLFNSITQPHYPSALAEGLKGAAQLLNSGVKAADDLITQSYKRDVNAEVNPEKEGFVTALETVKNKVEAANAPTTAADDTRDPGIYGPEYTYGKEGAPLNLVPPQNVPKDIQNLPTRLKTLESARDGGHIDDLDFRGRITQIAKEIRSRYPRDYRPEIDAYVDQVVRQGPANEYIAALMKRINSSLSGGDKEYHAMLGELRNNLKYPGMEEAYTQLLNRQITIPEAARRLAAQKHIEYSLDLNRKRAESFNAVTGTVRQEYGRLANQSATNIVRSYIQGTLDAGGMTFDKLQTIVRGIQNGDPAYKGMPSDWYTKMATSMDAMIQKASAQMDKEWSTEDKAGRTVNYYVGAKDLNDIKTAALFPLKQLRDALASGDLALAGQTALWAKLATADLNYKILSDPKIGGSYLMMGLIKSHGGDVAINQFMVRAAQAGKLNEWDMFVKNQILQLVTPDIDPRFAKDIGSFKEAIQQLHNTLKEQGIDKAPKTFDELFRVIDGPDGLSLVSPNTPVENKRIIFNKIFGEKNQGMLRLIDPDMRDRNGNRIPGMESLFYRLTKKDVADSVMALGPEYRDRYLASVRQMYEQDVAKVAIGKFSNMNLSTEGYFSVKWDPKNKKFFVDREGVDMTKPVTAFDAYRRFKGLNRPFQLVEDAVQDMNKGLGGLRSVAEAAGLEGQAVDMFMLEPLLSGGLAEERLKRLTGIPGLPSKMVDAIWTSYNAEKLKAEQERQRQLKAKEQYKQ